MLVFGTACAHGVKKNHETASIEISDQDLHTLNIDVDGLSGLTLASPDLAWAVAEIQRKIVKLAVSDKEIKPITTINIIGVADGLDTESVVALTPNTFILGTEQSGEHTSDALLFAQLANNELRVTSKVDVPYSLWDITMDDNHGIEGLCTAGNHLFAAIEYAKEESTADTRIAPLLMAGIDGSNMRPLWLSLTTKRGTLSDIACTIDAQGNPVVYAIERHFGVGRILRFTVPPEATQKTIVPDIIFDLSRGFSSSPNFEGIMIRDRSLFLLSDNHFVTWQGPTMWFRFPLLEQ